MPEAAKTHYEITGEAAEHMISLFHPEAQKVLRVNFEEIRFWMLRRIVTLGLPEDADISIQFGELNAYDQSGYGLQSVQVEIMKPTTEPYGKEILPEDEIKSPTIGVIAKGMLREGAPMRVVTFTPNNGVMEVIESLSANGIFAEDQRRDSDVKMPALLEVNQQTAATHSADHVAVAMETTLDKYETASTEVREGVYACLYKKEPKEKVLVEQ